MWSRRDCQDPGQRGRRLPSAGESGLYSRGRRQRDLPTGAAPGPPRPRAAGSRKCGDAAEPGEGSRCARGRVTVRAGSEPGRPGSEFPTTAQSQTPGPAPEAKKGARARRQEGLLEERRGRGRCCCRLPAMRTVYCMNEAEIVDVALGILIEGLSARDMRFCDATWYVCQRSPLPPYLCPTVHVLMMGSNGRLVLCSADQIHTRGSKRWKEEGR
ncbi:cell cycle regulator of non-homologous end joining isoform X6 [Pseudorca crassidens]|uniref:cell cycle regulator of non-homologous end joining isoform X6 n=1 Tax=Pseudorca crassidens TaxID=82174 RepID=UPI00352CF04B